jgi:putative iron-dependent peroxidase
MTSSTQTDPDMPRASAQPVDAPLTVAAIFLVMTVNASLAARMGVRSLCADLATLVRAVGARDLDGKLSCVMGVGV